MGRPLRAALFSQASFIEKLPSQTWANTILPKSNSLLLGSVGVRVGWLGTDPSKDPCLLSTVVVSTGLLGEAEPRILMQRWWERPQVSEEDT